MELSDEQKQALEEQKQQCPFCKIIKGEIPSKKVYEDNLFIGILDINPAKPGHILFMPKEHYPMMPFVPKETLDKFYTTLKTVSASQKSGMVCQANNIFIANGGVAGQQVAHFLVHLIPRDHNDAFTVFDTSPTEISPEKRAEIEKTLSHNLAIMFGKATYTKEQVLQLIEKNPPIKEMIQKNPDEFKKQLQAQPQLQKIFENVDIDEIIAQFSEKSVEETDETNLDDIAGLFK